MLEKTNNHKKAPPELVNALITLYRKKKFEDILSCSSKLIEQYPNTFELHNILGAINFEKGNKEEALKHFSILIKLFPKNPKAYNNLGATLLDLNQYKKAQKALKKAIKLEPTYAEAYNNLGNVYNEINQYDQAIKEYKKAIILNPEYYEAYNNLGIVLGKNKQFEEAEKSLAKAISINPLFPQAFNTQATLLIKSENFEKALEKIKRAIELKPDFSAAYRNLALIYDEFGDHNLSSENLKIAKDLDPNLFSTDPDYILYNSNYSPKMSAEEISKLYKEYNQKFGLPMQKEWKPFHYFKKTKKKLKVGYVSPDFNKHSAQNFLLPTLAHHNHQNFKIYAFAEILKEDHVTKQYQSLVDYWVPTQGFTDEEMVQKIRDLEIDVLVDLAGHTNGNRLGVFARKPAPISITWLGYGYTTGLSAIDYFLTDKVIAPNGSEHLFSEKIWRLNNYSFCCYQARQGMGDVGSLPALEKDHITFGTLTRAIRINDSVIKVWSDILKRVKHSKLVINSKGFKTLIVVEDFKKRFQKMGIDTNRLYLFHKSPPWDTMRQIDIALDCFPHNSGTTLIEHLYMGNPFITFANRPSVGKIGASILTALGRKEWIASSEQEYVDKVVALSTNIKKLASIRSSLRKDIETSPIMDHKGFVRELEKTYLSMWEKF